MADDGDPPSKNREPNNTLAPLNSEADEWVVLRRKKQHTLDAAKVQIRASQEEVGMTIRVSVA